MRYHKLNFFRIFKVLNIVVLALFLYGASPAQTRPTVITRDTLFRTLEEGKVDARKRISTTEFVRLLDRQKVDFRLTDEDEKKFRELGSYLRSADLNTLIAAVKRNFQIKPATDLPLKVEYRLISGFTLDFFLKKDNKKDWDANLGISGKLLIVNNNTYQTLKSLAENFSSDEAVSLAKYTVNNKRVKSLNPTSWIDYTDRNFFVGGGGYELAVFADGVNLGQQLSDSGYEDAKSLDSLNKKWRAIFSGGDPINGFPPLEFVRPVEKEDFARLLDYVDESNTQKQSASGRFYAYITKDYLPPDLAYVILSTEAGCEGVTVTFYGSFIVLKIVILENVSNETLKIGNFTVKENDSSILRSRENENNFLNSQQRKSQPLYSVGFLKPNEKIIVPLELMLMYPNDIFGKQTESVTSIALTPALEKQLRKQPPIKMAFEKETFNIDADKLVEITSRSQIKFTTERKYLYGPSVKIEDVEVNGVTYLVRPYNSAMALISGAGMELGSCPFIYTYDESDKTWRNEGAIMVGFTSEEKKSTDIKLLRRFDGRILIKEKEPEDSYIDSVKIRAKTSNGTEIIIYPKNKNLLLEDGNYIKLSQGENLLVEFNVPMGVQFVEYTLEASGYYTPYRLMERKVVEKP